MKSLALSLAALILASCSQLTAASPLPAAAPHGVGAPEATLFTEPSSGTPDRRGCHHLSFCNIYDFGSALGSRHDGAGPHAPLVELNGDLYGTTTYGGRYERGTVFKVTTSGKETVLYSFHGPPDGENPAAGLLAVNGKLYGISAGGDGIFGAVFEVTTSGTERVLYRFTEGHGVYPTGSLISVKGTLYGTASSGGPHNRGDGIVFALSKTGEERVVYEFPHITPSGGVIYAKGNLYGTVSPGPGSNCCGYVFELSLSGTERVLYEFKGPPHGAFPSGGVIYQNGDLYGTTEGGGANGWGAVFKVNAKTGRGRILYSFQKGITGTRPSGLLALDGVLYGTTSEGGEYGGGTIFAVSAGRGTRLYSFGLQHSEASLIALNDDLFGTTVGVPHLPPPYRHGSVFRFFL